MSLFIPAGKTSLVQRGNFSLQVQTEYAYRPIPRITTTVLHNGQVLHKFEQKLGQAVKNIEEQNQIEDVIKKQHIDILSLIRTVSKSKHQPETTAEQSEIFPATPEQKEELQTESPPEEIQTESPSVEQRVSLQEQFAKIPGFEHCFQVDNEGNFKSEIAARQFRRKFRKIFKIRVEMIEVFPRLASDPTRRETGIYEIERDKLYLVSTGDNCAFITVNPTNDRINYEKAIKETALPVNISV